MDFNGIEAKVLKARGDFLYQRIHEIVEQIWKKQELSNDWKRAMMVLVHKKGDKMNVQTIETLHC